MKRKLLNTIQAFRLRGVVFFYLAIIIGMTSAACYFSYEHQKTELLSKMEMSLFRLANEYQNIVGKFWDVYLPAYENKYTEILSEYFSDDIPLSPLQVMELKQMMRQMTQRSDYARWMIISNPARESDYFYQVDGNILKEISGIQSYDNLISNKKRVLEVYGDEDVFPEIGDSSTIVLSGGAPLGYGSGSICVGYETSSLDKIVQTKSSLSSLQFAITWKENTIFRYGEGKQAQRGRLKSGESGIIMQDKIPYYTMVSSMTPQNSYVYCAVRNSELLLRSHCYTPMILLIVGVLLLLSFALYRLIMYHINKEIGYLQSGLKQLGDNHLDYRIRDTFHQSDFQQIAVAINAMAENLQKTINRVYEYEIRQRDAEMQELQAKFNPHFLYNSLEMFRARCYDNGDEETADLIAQTASIFRGFINPNTFITISEELAFSRRYLALFRARYGDSVTISYDIEPAVMEYGVIRNVFQPIIENYFVHGMDSDRDNNILCFRGRILDEKTLRITVEDNGLGVDEDTLKQLTASLNEQSTTEKESYGLKNLSQRIRLFYGEGYGLKLALNPHGGLIIEMDIARWTCEEVKQRMPHRK